MICNFGFEFSKTENLPSKVRQNKVGENGYCINYFIKQSFCHTFQVIPKAQNYRECIKQDKKSNIQKFQKKIPSTVHLSRELELICLVYEGESL